jgi:hypothetical protein
MDEAEEMAEEESASRKAEENRDRIEALEEALEEVLKKKFEGLKGDLKEGLGQVVGQMVEEKLQPALAAERSLAEERSDLEERLSSAEEAIRGLETRLDQGVEVKQTEEMKDLRRKISRFLSLADLRKEQEKTMSNEIQRLRRWKGQTEREMKERQRKLDSAERTTRDSAETIRTAAWWSPVTAFVGGLVGLVMMALLTRVGYTILPQSLRMTPTEIEQVMQERNRDVLEQEMTEEELNQYRESLKKAEKRLRERQD